MIGKKLVTNYLAGETGFFRGVCLSWRMIDLIRVTSLLARLDLGLKSQSLEMRSHSVPGSISSDSATNCFSAFLKKYSKQHYIRKINIKVINILMICNVCIINS